MSAQTLPSDFVYAEDARPVSITHANVCAVILPDLQLIKLCLPLC